MSLVDLIGKVAVVDRTLQKGANNIAHKVNEIIGISNYQISSFLFGASAAVAALPAAYYGFTEGEPALPVIAAPFVAFSIYQILRNSKLEKWEKSNSEQSGDAIAVDFNLLEAKRALLDSPSTFDFEAKPAYFSGLVAASLPPNLIPVFSSYTIAYFSAQLLGQYFREADYLMPTSKNRVFNFFKSLIPKPQLRPRYEAPISTSVA